MQPTGCIFLSQEKIKALFTASLFTPISKGLSY